MDLVAGPDEIPIAPAYPTDDVGKGIAERPEVGFGELREAAGDRVRLPERPVCLDQDGNAEVRIELEKFFALPGRERRRKLEFDWRFQETRRGHREARIVVAAEIELPLAHEGDHASLRNDRQVAWPHPARRRPRIVRSRPRPPTPRA